MRKIKKSDVAMILIDHQLGVMEWVGSIEHDVIKGNARALARTAVALDIPIVFTSSMEDAAQGHLMPELEKIAPEAFANRIKRQGIVNCWNDENFANACRNTGKKIFIMAGITTDVCLAPPAIGAKEEGFNVIAIADASGSPTKLTDELAYRRMEHVGIELTSTNAIISELAYDWASEDGQKLAPILIEEVL